MKVFLFADKTPPQIGGMETHALYFARSFSRTDDLTIISKRGDEDVILDNSFKNAHSVELLSYLKQYGSERCVVFYNSGRWIERLRAIKEALPLSSFFYRTGGNEIVKAPLSLAISSHKDRQSYWIKMINENIEHLISNSTFTTERLKGLGIRPSIITIARGGICPDKIREAQRNRLEFRTSIGIGPDEKLLVCCCRFVPYKRVDFLLRAFSYVPTPVKLYMIGDGPLFEQSKTLARDMSLNNVEFAGLRSHEESLQYIGAADLYCQASYDLKVIVEGGEYIHTEGMGRSLIESICCGTRVCVTSAGAVDEYINEENGLIIKGNEKDFAEGIAQQLGLPRIPNEKCNEYMTLFDFDSIFETYRSLM